MQEINLEVNIMKPEDNRAILHYIADNLVCYTSLANLAEYCKCFYDCCPNNRCCKLSYIPSYASCKNRFKQK